jgi:hypothetical protein
MKVKVRGSLVTGEWGELRRDVIGTEEAKK